MSFMIETLLLSEALWQGCHQKASGRHNVLFYDQKNLNYQNKNINGNTKSIYLFVLLIVD